MQPSNETEAEALERRKVEALERIAAALDAITDGVWICSCGVGNDVGRRECRECGAVRGGDPSPIRRL
jgi:PAS domain-containing protein